MKINGPAADGTTAGVMYLYLGKPCQQTSQKQDGCTDLFHLFFLNRPGADSTAVNDQTIFLICYLTANSADYL